MSISIRYDWKTFVVRQTSRQRLISLRLLLIISKINFNCTCDLIFQIAIIPLLLTVFLTHSCKKKSRMIRSASWQQHLLLNGEKVLVFSLHSGDASQHADRDYYRFHVCRAINGVYSKIALNWILISELILIF